MFTESFREIYKDNSDDSKVQHLDILKISGGARHTLSIDAHERKNGEIDDEYVLMSDRVG